ncbi:MAG: hypothetical protein K2Q26_10290 [Bdellovibrionales bacterium]|nr:hypothetical protein [Bdellovibrionales bacterium]
MTKKEEEKDILTPTLLFLAKAARFIVTVLVHGIIRKGTWTKNVFIFWIIWLVWSALIVFGPRWNLPILLDVLTPNYLPQLGIWIYRHMSKPTQLLILFLGGFLGWLFFRGIAIWMERLKF